jgi:SNF2 family DNA or RNA helicase
MCLSCTVRIAMEGRCEVVLTSFETARDFIHDINQVAWRTVIVDECHRIKEPAARTTIALKSLGTEYLSILRIVLFLKYANAVCQAFHSSG